MELSALASSSKPSPRAAAAPLLRGGPAGPVVVGRRRLRAVRRLRCVAAAAAGGEGVFGGRRELSGVQPLVEAVPPVARAAAELVVAAAAVAAGYGAGLRAGGGSRAVAVAGAAALGAASFAGAAAVNSVVPEVAAVGVHNYVAGCDDPTEVDGGEVKAIASKYGVSTQDATFKAELCDLYARFVYSLLPRGGGDLKGDEVGAIIKFKRALGLDDVDAANVHLEIGRRICGERLEMRGRDADIGQRQAFEKLIYVSNLVFGDASESLLPWKRLFGVTDSQINTIMLENAKSLYASQLNSIGRGLDIGTLIEVRREQLAYKLSDEIAAEMFRDHAKKLVQENISSALDNLKSNNSTQAVDEVKSILAFNSLLTILSKFPNEDRFVRGLGPISLGAESDHDRMADDLKLLYRAYATEILSDGVLDDGKLAPLNQLRNIFGLGKYEAEAIILEAKGAYQKETC